jgi:pentatricopeptide repeat protein
MIREHSTISSNMGSCYLELGRIDEALECFKRAVRADIKNPNAHNNIAQLYIQTGKVKPTSHQLAANPKAEICAFTEGTWVRIACELVEDDRFEAKKSMLDAYPNLRGMYDENDGNTQVLYMKNAKATISSFGKPSETVEF